MAALICHLAAIALGIATVSDPIDALVAAANANPFWGNGNRPVIRLPANATEKRIVAMAVPLELPPSDRSYQVIEKRSVRIQNQLYHAVLIRTDSERVVMFLHYENQEWDVIPMVVGSP